MYFMLSMLCVRPRLAPRAPAHALRRAQGPDECRTALSQRQPRPGGRGAARGGGDDSQGGARPGLGGGQPAALGTE
eukprot:scaffold104845_cov30-Phaeocystis_antarctica.AAC.1